MFKSEEILLSSWLISSVVPSYHILVHKISLCSQLIVCCIWWEKLCRCSLCCLKIHIRSLKSCCLLNTFLMVLRNGPVIFRKDMFSTSFTSSSSKVSYSCMNDVKSVISRHNKRALSKAKFRDVYDNTNEKLCNCRNINKCLLDSICLTKDQVYHAETIKESKDKKPT